MLALSVSPCSRWLASRSSLYPVRSNGGVSPQEIADYEVESTVLSSTDETLTTRR